MKKTILITTFLLLTHCSLLFAQGQPAPEAGEPIKSMGQPSKWEFYLAPMALYDGDLDKWGGQLTGGLWRYLMNPNFGIGLAGEGYLGAVDSETDSGVRALAGVKMFFLQAGIDYSFRRDELDAIIRLEFPLRRGGLFGRGGKFRVDWLPGRDDFFNFGLTFPFGQPYKGKTRTKHDRVTLPPLPPEKPVISEEIALASKLGPILDQARHAASWMNKYTTPFFDQDLSKGEDELASFRQKVLSFKAHLNLADDQYPEGHTPYAETLAYHRAIDQAFTMALEGNGEDPQSKEKGTRIADEARKILLEDVIIPYTRLLGQNKKNDSLLGYGVRAGHRFEGWLDQHPSLSEARKEAALYVFQEVLRIIDSNREGSKGIWGDSKLVWIPMHYGLKPLQCDSQKEMDGILEKVTENKFVHGNDTYYVINEQFQPEVARMILEAEDYHVLWIHDYRGVTPVGNPDRIGFGQTLYGYLHAMTNRARAYDEKGEFPVYLIIIDQFYYEANKGKLWLDLLEDPLGYELRLPQGYKAWEKQIREAQNQLRSAVASSSRLQEEARRFGEDWLSKKIKVHVNITHPADWSFRSAHLIDNFPIAPDVLMHDHRKISFYDVTELDPGKGEAIHGGLGIGEHYAGPTWEDRAILMRGPALLALKDAARQVLLQQGFKEDEIPAPLRPLPKPPNYEQMVNALVEKGWDATLMDIHNETGFRSKPINAVKATLYSLMPPGSTIIVPDSLWNSPFWGGMLAGAALRGCKVLVIAPALANAPSAGFPQMSRAYELFSRLIIVQNELQNEIESAGGMLKLGKFSSTSEMGDYRAGFEEFRKGIRKYPFIKEIFPFRQDVYDAIDALEQELEKTGFQPTYYTEDIEKRRPKLHLKTNFFASQEMQDLLAWEGWADVMLYYGRHRTAFLGREEGTYVNVKDVPEEAEEAVNTLLSSYWNSLSEEEKHRVMYYLSIGSQNQDYRGTIMDGEVAAVISGYYSLIGVMDLFFMSASTTWVENIEDLDALLPPESGWRRWLGRYIQKAL
jgi:hypothetical protein